MRTDTIEAQFDDRRSAEDAVAELDDDFAVRQIEIQVDGPDQAPRRRAPVRRETAIGPGAWAGGVIGLLVGLVAAFAADIFHFTGPYTVLHTGLTAAFIGAGLGAMIGVGVWRIRAAHLGDLEHEDATYTVRLWCEEPGDANRARRLFRQLGADEVVTA